jgi:predicted transcriptional regulator
MADDTLKVIVGGGLKDDLASFRSAWERTERGEHVTPERVLAFESWEGLARVLTGERYRLLRHLHAHPAASISALARSLGRHLRRVQADVRALEQAGLVDRSEGGVRAAADRIAAEIQL